MTCQAALTVFVLMLCASPCTSQSVRILVLDARHGKPVQNECIELSLGAWHGADLFAPTDKSGIATLSFFKDHVSAVPSADNKMCGQMNLTKSFSTAGVPTTLSPLPHANVSCQYSKDQTRNPDWLHNPLYQRVIPSFSLRDILKDGIVGANTCSKLKPKPVPGELILIVRKITFLEGMRE